MRWHRFTRRRVMLAGLALLILGFLGTLNTTTRYLALGLLRREPFYDRRPLSYWVYLIKTREPEREQALQVLGRLGPENSEAIPVLIRILEEGLRSESDVVKSIRRAWQSPKDEEEAQERARQALAAVAEALGRIGPEAQDAIPVLVRYLTRGEVGNKAAGALVDIGPAAAPALLEVVADKKTGIVDGSHRRALLALSRLGASAREAVPVLLNTLQSMDDQRPSDDSRMIIYALGKIGPEARAAVPVLIESVRKSKFSFVTDAVVEALGDIGPEARAAVPFLLDLRRKACSLHVSDIFLRKEIVRSLRRIDAHAATEAASIRPPWSDEAIHHYAQSNTPFTSPRERIARLDEAVRLEPRFAAAYIARGKLYHSVGDPRRALADYDQAVRFDPQDANAYYRRATAYADLGEQKRAIADFDRSLDLSPARDAYNDLAWLLATSPDAAVRDGSRAVRLASKACKLSEWKAPAELDTLAAAYAETGNLAEAVRWQQKALELFKIRKESGDGAYERLKLYEAHKPYRQARVAPAPSTDLDAVLDHSFGAAGSSKGSAFLLCFETTQSSLRARVERAAPLRGFIWTNEGSGGGSGNRPDGEYEYHSKGLRIICSPETLELYLRTLSTNFEKTARESETQMSNFKEELEEGHWVGFRFEYTSGQAHGSVSAEVTGQDSDPDNPGQKIYYLLVTLEETRP